MRQATLEKLLDKYRRDDGEFDVLVPVSGGKDGSYVAHNLKTKYGMNPLALTITPPLSLEVGDQNLKNFIQSGYNHIQINLHPEVTRLISRHGFIEFGFPYYGWAIGVQSAPVMFAHKIGIGLIFYGEDGEVEYGGSTQTAETPTYDVSYMKKVYLEGGHEKVLELLPKSLQNQLTFWHFPTDEDLRRNEVKIAHWSYFENWDPYRNYLVAKEFCGLKESEMTNTGTFTNFSQTDQALYSLHAYLMYLKFGFGRATQDAGIEIRRGAMRRDQGVNLVRIYDNAFPEEHIDAYLDYYKMSREEFDSVLDRWANKELFEKKNGRWMPNFRIS